MNQELELKLQAWVDGELTGGDARRMAQLATQDPQAVELAAELRGVKAAMTGAELARSISESREFYWSKIERQIRLEERRSPTWITRWRRFLMPLAGLATASCVVLFTLTQSKPAPQEPFTSTDEAMDTTTFSDQSAGLTVVWLQDKDAPKPAASPVATDDDSTVTD